MSGGDYTPASRLFVLLLSKISLKIRYFFMQYGQSAVTLICIAILGEIILLFQRRVVLKPTAKPWL